MPILILRRTLPSLLLLVLLSSVSAGAMQTPAPEVVARVKNAVVLITTYDNHGKPEKQGSGFFLTPQRVVTNLHVVDSASRIRISTFTGREVFVDSVLASDKADDLALLQLDTPCLDVTTLGLEDVEPLAGDSVMVVSNPLGAHWQVTVGEVGLMWYLGDIGERMGITACLLPGSSGGPVLNLQGRVIGVATMYMLSDENLNFAVPAGRLKVLQTTVATSTVGAFAHRK